jgi:hypothetical protein
MKSSRLLCSLCVLCASAINVFSLDREAFTFTNYDLNVQVDPEQQRLGVRGKITLRNNTSTPQKLAVLQISSSLGWRSIKLADRPVQFVTQPYTSDIDHTGALSEAIVTLPEAILAKGSVDLDVAYEGVIAFDATRLTRIGMPGDLAKSSDWDQISTKFTGVRGVGYVAWYPIATEAADMADGNNLFDVVGRWKTRETAAKMEITLSYPTVTSEETPPAILCDGAELNLVIRGGSPKWPVSKCSYPVLGWNSPTFLSADYKSLAHSNFEVDYLPGHDAAAANFADAAEKVLPFISVWFGEIRERAKLGDVANSDAAPFESGSLLLTPLATFDPKLAGLAAVHQFTHAAFFSPRPWINEGLAHFAQALYVEREKGRPAALDYLSAHRSSLNQAEKTTGAPGAEDETNRSLVNTFDEELYRGKAMYIWWMLRDMVGDEAMKKAIASYRAEQDKESSYMQRLIQAQTKKDLEWFFDDWVYRDRGLPNFKIESVVPRKTLPEGYLVAVTVNNLGAAGAEVPVTIKFQGGEITQRLVIRGKSNAVFRVQVPKQPEEVVVNDGSVPESDMSNNVFKIEDVDSAK